MNPVSRLLVISLFYGALFVPVAVAQDALDLTPTGTVEDEVDRFAGDTKVRLSKMVLTTTPSAKLVFAAKGEFTGAPKPPETIAIRLVSIRTGGVKYTAGQLITLYVIADGERLKFDLPNTDQSTYYNVAYLESFESRVSFPEARKVLRAKKVEMRFDGIEFTLSDDQLATFRTFLKHLGDDK